ncbi:autotransporter assembly complex protein TamA [Sphingomonas crocodyli]|uniref:Outer membrane protein assembly factor n=1 Tax=Sphingomonas crocodyli TaxID=1979270 RepID=A0A437M8L1_9SPHN|nr:BamA/TamA family outer membrane protein [Sphingomonas crocodyli]RVT94050.1 outer membrane protein assembly factor [Sphingomonas crocodyli]
MKAGRASLGAQSLAVIALFCAGARTEAQGTAPVAPETLPSSDTAGLDPASDMAPLPDLGVEWPSMDGEDASSGGATTKPDKDAETGVDEQAEQHYQIAIEGLQDAEGLSDETRAGLKLRFDSLSALKEGDGKGNIAQIDRRARQDEELLGELLRAAGYYEANVSTRIERPAGGKLRVVLDADPGTLYTLAAIDLPGIEAAGDRAPEVRKALGLKIGDPVDADKITAGQAAVTAELGREGFVFAKVAEPELTVDHEAHNAALVMGIEPNGSRKFGKITIEGDRLFSAKHIGRIARFRPGQPYDSARIEDLRRALIQTGLVSAVTIKPVETSDPDVVDVSVKLEPAPARTISGALGYGTGEGYRVEASWQHRNLIRPEGGVTFRGVLGTQEQTLGAVLRRNNYKARDRVLTGQVYLSHLDQNAYEARSLTIAAGMERQTNIIWQKKWTWFYGVEFVASKEDDTVKATGAPRSRQYLIGAFPTGLTYDGSDDLLNPSKGYRLSGRVSPEASLQGSAFGYVKAQVDGSYYMPVTDRVVMAGRVRLGSIFGAGAERIAPTRRFYAGGGGSVRGFGYQKIGPVDVNGDPAGGRSLAEFSIESRVRFGDFGVVPFIDGGNLYAATLPTFDNLRYGAGLGVRYYTSFGPIRVDVGTPLNRRPGDSRVTVYVSLGQAF